MQSKEDKIIMGVVMAAMVFGMFNTSNTDCNESKTIFGQEMLQINQRSVLAYASYYEEGDPIQINESTAKGAESQESIPEETVPQEAAIDLEKIDQALLGKIRYEIADEKSTITDFVRDDKIIMGEAEGYSGIKGVTCFRGNHHRDSASYGYAEVLEKKLEIIWETPIGRIDGWTGVGWNGQPAIVEWPEKLRSSINIREEKKNKEGLREVIYAALDGEIYFLDLEDGSPTRERIRIPGPVKGSLTVDPRGVPLLYVGQGINTVNGQKVEMGYRIYSLIDQKKLFFINGSDPFAHRGWPAFDSTALISAKTDTLILAGENGIFYTIKLNTDYNESDSSIAIDPEVIKYRYKISGNSYQGIENSVAVYKNLAYFADNGGWLQCVDLNALRPVWIKDVTDDTDSTIVIEEEKDGLAVLYTACEVDKQGVTGVSIIRKIDALSGQLVWEKPYECHSILGDKPVNGGALATPIVGKNSLNQMVIYNLARFGGLSKGLIIALDKSSGEEAWRLELPNYSWSSPVDVYTKEGNGYIISCDSVGRMYLIDGLTGQVLDTINLGANIEGSPAVFENMIVVGTRGQKIFGVRIY